MDTPAATAKKTLIPLARVERARRSDAANLRARVEADPTTFNAAQTKLRDWILETLEIVEAGGYALPEVPQPAADDHTRGNDR